MRNLFLYIAVLLLGVSNGFAQILQNANWVFPGNGGLNFNLALPQPQPLPLGLLNYTEQGNSNASASDQAGNLLFYTDGFTVWNNTNQILTNGTGLLYNLGDFSQNIVIVPNPSDINKFYIVTISSGQLLNGDLHGLRYSEVDMTDGFGIVTNMNTALPDDSGFLIDDDYFQNFGKITTARHSNGFHFWIIVEIGSEIYSYLVNNQGIQPPITSISPLPPTLYLNTNGNSLTSGNGPMKISPDNSRILIGYTEILNQNGSDPTGRIYEGIFNNTTGHVSNYIQLEVPVNITEALQAAEFSPNNLTVYRYYGSDLVSEGVLVSSIVDFNGVWIQQHLETFNTVDINCLQRAIDGRIYFTQVSTLSGQNPFFLGVINNPNQVPYNIQTASINAGATSFIQASLPTWVHFQPLCGEITGLVKVGCTLQWDDTAASYIIEVVADNQCHLASNSADAYGNTFGSITTSNNFIDINNLGEIAQIKQFRWRIRTECGIWSDWCCIDNFLNNSCLYPISFPNGSCFYDSQPCNAEYNLNITQEVFATENNEEQAANVITASNIINSGATADYHAGIAVVLSNGFHAETGSVFRGYIEDCVSNSSRMSNSENNKKNTNIDRSKDHISATKTINKSLKIYPNPSTSFTEISVESTKINYVRVSSMEGKVIFNQRIESNAYYLLDTSSFSKGIYILSVETNDGKIYCEKLIKY
jgi:hypothetical protein